MIFDSDLIVIYAFLALLNFAIFLRISMIKFINFINFRVCFYNHGFIFIFFNMSVPIINLVNLFCNKLIFIASFYTLII